MHNEEKEGVAMTPAEKLHIHHEKLIGTIRDLAERAKSDNAEASLLITFCSEYLISHAEAEEVTLYKASTDAAFVESMIHEHREIKDILEAIGSAYGKGNSAGIVSETEEFITLLDKHFGEEENALMLGLTKELSREELEGLVQEAHQVEAEKKKSDLWSLFEHDHKRIDFNISRLRKSAGSPEAANGIYSKVRAQLLKHIELEEAVLFPAFSEHAEPAQTGPVQVMIAEHREITSILVTAGNPVDGNSLGQNIDALIGRLAVHNKKEELILYPMINRALRTPDRVKIFKECFEGMAAV